MLKISFVILLPLLFGFRFNPMSQSLELGQTKSAQFSVENDTDEKMAIELSVHERKMNADGIEELPKTSEISVFPPQMIIPAKEKRTVRVVWNGEKIIKSERSFRVVAEQLPLELNEKKKGTGIKMLMKYMAAFYVTPAEAESKLTAQILEIKDKNIKVKISNSGNKHQLLFHPKLTMRKASKTWVFKEKDLPKIAGENILANSERVFFITTSEIIPTDAEISLKVED